MKKIIAFFSWMFKACYSFMSNKPKPTIVTENKTSLGYRIDYSEDVPLNMKNETIYIIQDGLEPEALALKCPCGCNSNIVLNLLADASPRWSYELLSDDSINISPSIWRKCGCKSHFFIIESNVKWL